MRDWIDLFEDEGPKTLVDIAMHILQCHDDLIDDDEDYEDFAQMDERQAEEILRREYLSGTCGAYAIALHDKTNYPIVALHGGMHFAVQAPDGDLIDYAGKASPKKVARRYGMTAPSLQPWTREETVDHVLMGDFEGSDGAWCAVALAKKVLDYRGMA